MWKDAKQFLVKIKLFNAVVIVESGISSPTQMECTVNVCLCPFHDFADLIPVGSFFIWHIVKRCTSDNHAVITAVLDLVKGVIKLF